MRGMAVGSVLKQEIAEALGMSPTVKEFHDGTMNVWPDFYNPAIFWPEFLRWVRGKTNFQAQGLGNSKHFIFHIGDSAKHYATGRSDESLTEAGCRAWADAIRRRNE